MKAIRERRWFSRRSGNSPALNRDDYDRFPGYASCWSNTCAMDLPRFGGRLTLWMIFVSMVEVGMSRAADQVSLQPRVLGRPTGDRVSRRSWRVLRSDTTRAIPSGHAVFPAVGVADGGGHGPATPHARAQSKAARRLLRTADRRPTVELPRGPGRGPGAATAFVDVGLPDPVLGRGGRWLELAGHGLQRPSRADQINDLPRVTAKTGRAPCLDQLRVQGCPLRSCGDRRL